MYGVALEFLNFFREAEQINETYLVLTPRLDLKDWIQFEDNFFIIYVQAHFQNFGQSIEDYFIYIRHPYKVSLFLGG